MGIIYDEYIVITAAAGLDINYDASIRHYRYMLHDVKSENMIQYFDEAVQRIDKGMGFFMVGLKWGSVLVHCGAGVSRVYSIVYVVCHAGYCLSD